MKYALILPLLFTTALAAQPKRVIIGGGGPDETKNWPQPKVEAGRTVDQKAAAIESYAQSLVDTDHYSGVVLVAKDGKQVLAKAWGMAGDGEKNSIETKFNIGSINKVFTRIAIEQLAAAGKLSLDDTVRKHLPNYPSPVADKITIRQLLNHRSGLGDFFGPKYVAAPPARLRELSDFLPLFVDTPLEFEPGTSQRYSNAGFIVLGLIIEKESGEKYRDYVQKHLFEPAGVKDIGFWSLDEKVPHRAMGYTMRGPEGPLPKRAPNTATLPGRPSSAGGAFATAPALLKFFQWTKEDGIGVAGGSPGSNAAVEIDGGWAVIALSNFDPPSAEAMARGAMRIINADGAEQQQVRRAPTAPEKTELSGPVAVPLKTMEHLVTVEAKINGKGPFRFVIDSGAGGMMRVSPELAKSLALEQIGEARSGDPSGKNVTTVPIVGVDSLEIGGAKFSGVHASVGGRLGAVQPDGVLGLGVFGAITATIDYPRSELRMTRDPLPANGEHVVAFTRPRGVPEIELVAGGVKVKADVDTGSPALLSVPPSFGVPLASELRVVGRGRTANNEFEIKAAELRGDLAVAGWNVAGPTIDVVDHFPVANIGSRFLRDYAVTFDMVNGRLELKK